MKKYRKSIWLPVALLVYTTAMAVYFIPRNTEISDTEKYLTVGLSYMTVSYTHLRAHETDSYLVCRLLLEKKKKNKKKNKIKEKI